MNQFKQALLCLCFVLLLVAAPVHMAAAAPGNLPVEVVVDDPSTFWACTYYAKENMPTTASEIKLEWSAGNSSKPQRETIVLKGKESGKLSIPVEKGTLVNLQVYVVNTKNEKLGAWSLQLLNNGKTEVIRVFSPASVQPEFNRD
ncbi:hypothetical protein [Anaerospora hongkongensis]|uniref:hypothetical protein n=1 Tax=Anaerospora hongkongensis TaxID=244830 RepID=UPI00289E7FA6|nr:hypothetical protein [Anaerospora hongkongensis]